MSAPSEQHHTHSFLLYISVYNVYNAFNINKAANDMYRLALKYVVIIDECRFSQ